MSIPGHDRGRQRLAAFLSTLLVAGLVAFTGLTGLASSVAFAAGAQRVTIGATLSPKAVTVAPGTTVTWTSADGDRHRVRSTSGPAKLDSDDITAGHAWSFTFTARGTYAYVDDRNKDNAALHGTITVGTVPAGGGGGGSAPPAPATASVSIAGKAFNPSSTTVAINGVVTWKNNDSMPHNVTSNTAGAFHSATLNPGAVFTFRFTKAGTYGYVCTFHSGMSGTVIVPTATGAVPPAPKPAPPVTHPNPPVAPPVAAAPGKPGKHTVTISDAGFTPANLSARAGDTVTWVNRGAMPHTATAAGGAFDLPISPGASASTVLQAPGTIHYVCTYHAFMTATIVVAKALAGVVVAPPPAQPAVAAGSAGSAGASSGAAAAGGGVGQTYQIQVKDNSFSPSTVQARVGDTIVWTNAGKMPHTVTANDGSFNHTPLSPGETFSYALRAQGTVAYVCSFHPGMSGTLVVGAALAGVAVPPASAGSSSGGSATVTPSSAAAPASKGKTKTYEIKVKEMTFAPVMQNARVGDTISWVNVGSIPHTVTAKNGSFDKLLAPGARFNLVLRKQGTIDYVCTFHPGMNGMLMVGAALAGVAVPGAPGADASAPAPAAPHQHGNTTTYEIQVKENSFSPAMLNARVGDTVSWVNVGTTVHTVTARDHSFDKTLAPGKRFNLVLTKQGTIEYLCTPHRGMFGTLMVGPALKATKAGGLPLSIRSLPEVALVAVVSGLLLLLRRRSTRATRG
jgi:plastocyanin